MYNLLIIWTIGLLIQYEINPIVAQSKLLFIETNYMTSTLVGVKCSVPYSSDATKFKVHLQCPLSQLSPEGDICYTNCSSLCTSTQCNQVIRSCQYESQSPSQVSLTFLINTAKLEKPGHWRCLFKTQKSLSINLNPSENKDTTTALSITSTPVSSSNKSHSIHRPASSAPNNKIPDQSKSLSTHSIDVISITQPGVKSNLNPTISETTMSSSDQQKLTILEYMTRPELVLILVISLGCSLLLNLCFLIRCVLLKSVIENIGRSKSNSKCLMNCLCLDRLTISMLHHHSNNSAFSGYHGGGGVVNMASYHPYHHSNTNSLNHQHHYGYNGGGYHDNNNNSQTAAYLQSLLTNSSSDSAQQLLPHAHTHTHKQQPYHGNGSVGIVGGSNGGPSPYHHMTHSFSSTNGMMPGSDFYRCQQQQQQQQQILSNLYPDNSLQIYDDLSAVSNNSATPAMLNNGHNNSITTNNNTSTQKITRSVSATNQEATSELIQLSSQATPVLGGSAGTGSLSSSLSRRYNSRGTAPAFYYHPGLGNYVVVSGPIHDTNQYTIGAAPPLNMSNHNIPQHSSTSGSISTQMHNPSGSITLINNEEDGDGVTPTPMQRNDFSLINANGRSESTSTTTHMHQELPPPPTTILPPPLYQNTPSSIHPNKSQSEVSVPSVPSNWQSPQQNESQSLPPSSSYDINSIN